MVDEGPEGTHVDFEILAVQGTSLLVRFRINDRRFDTGINWDGTGDVLELLKTFAPTFVREFNKPPPPSFDLLQQQVGKQGHVVVPNTP